MTFTRVSRLGSTGLLLLELLGCSATGGSDGTRTTDAATQKERADRNTIGATTCDPIPPGTPLDLESLKWKNTLTRPPVYVPKSTSDEQGPLDDYTVTVTETKVQMLPDCYPKTPVFAYSGLSRKDGATETDEEPSSPGATFEMTRGTRARVTWINQLKSHFLPVDPTLHWADPKKLELPPNFDNYPENYPDAQSPVPIVTHVHGLEVGSASDGGPEAWFTAGKLPPNLATDSSENAQLGPAFKSAIAQYPNSQPATMLWYHDHALGITRLNVYAGLAGLYIIRDPEHEPANLPDRAHEMPLVIQDKSFNPDGTLVYTSDRSAAHPYWSSYFAGDTFVVNGKVWPDMKVERTRYRFRMLNAGNNRTFNFKLPGQRAFTVIGSDGGLLATPLQADSVKLAPGERADVLVDFSTAEPGSTIILSNDQAEVLRFSVSGSTTQPVPPPPPPQTLVTPVELTPSVGLGKRTVTLVSAPDGGYLLNGRMFEDAVTETPQVGSTEDWDIVNISGDDHPIHLHLVQFRVLSRDGISGEYATDWTAKNGSTLPLPKDQPTQNPNPDLYLTHEATPLSATETGWKDTVLAPSGYITRIRVRWAPQEAKSTTAPGDNLFPFDPTDGPGYVWHCHMLEHEDNEMMRPLKLTK